MLKIRQIKLVSHYFPRFKFYVALEVKEFAPEHETFTLIQHRAVSQCGKVTEMVSSSTKSSYSATALSVWPCLPL
jgi:hypothetical protein